MTKLPRTIFFFNRIKHWKMRGPHFPKTVIFECSCLGVSLLKRKGDISATVFIIKTDKAKMFMTSHGHNQVLELHRV